MRESASVAVAIVTAVVLVAAAHGSNQGRFTMKGTVTSVVDGDTLNVRLVGGKRERVRLVGIDAPERGTCYAAQAAAAARRLAQGERVTIRGDATQDTRDRYNRLLAYVWLPRGRDLGFQLIQGGFGKVYVYDAPFQRLSAYRNAESVARGLARSVWTCDRRPARAAPPSRCHPSYEGACLNPFASDYDCAGGSGNGPEYTGTVRVVGPDDFRLDSDGDGYGCE